MANSGVGQEGLCSSMVEFGGDVASMITSGCRMCPSSRSSTTYTGDVITGMLVEDECEISSSHVKLMFVVSAGDRIRISGFEDGVLGCLRCWNGDSILSSVKLGFFVIEESVAGVSVKAFIVSDLDNVGSIFNGFQVEVSVFGDAFCGCHRRTGFGELGTLGGPLFRFVGSFELGRADCGSTLGGE